MFERKREWVSESLSLRGKERLNESWSFQKDRELGWAVPDGRRGWFFFPMEMERGGIYI